ncbi:MAG: FtsH protease activity modulator HflK, partial [Gammaproteobacteria bacterium]|nr:FtsH protease activity modulator HflK [Gammaproteobacteria bacterium]
NVRDPDETLRQGTESAIREAIGQSKMDFVLTQGQSDIASRTKVLIQNILDRYETGLEVTSVNLQSAQPPQEVRGAFEDAIRAREDKQRFINEADAYSNDIIPKARGNAARQLEEAAGYKARVIARAEGESKRFTSLLAEYEKAPEVTRDRLYIDMMQSVMSNTSKVMVDVEGGNNLLYLPLDKLMGQGSQASIDLSKLQEIAPAPISVPSVAPQSAERRLRDSLRNRGVR